ncbi:hypothetical protein BH10PLA2_BH10PLA2_37370 [soil metagenome]
MTSAAAQVYTSCPNSNQLLALLTDELQGSARVVLEDHLAICPRCQSALLEMAGGIDLTPLGQQPPETDHGFGSLTSPPSTDEPRRGFLQSIPDPNFGLSGGPASVGPFSAATEDFNLPGLEIIDELGRGGLGVVYLAWQQSLCRLVAVKLVSKEWVTSPEQRERALRGAAAVVRLHHPNIVQVYHLGQHGTWVYGILEYLEGGTLAERMTSKPWDSLAAASLLRTLAEAVGFVHKHGFIHRDLKPANILFKADGTPKLADFGLARSIVSGGKLTLDGEALGTPRFMAPEQAQGNKQVGPQLDIHALGVIFFELLTAKPLFQGGTKYETIYQVVHQIVTPPDQIQPDIPPALVRICMKCLEKDPAKRYANGTELAGALSDYLQDSSPNVRPGPVHPEPALTSAPTPNRMGRLVPALLALVIVEACGLLWLGSASHSGEENADRKNSNQPIATTELTRAKQQLQESTLTLAQIELQAGNRAAARQWLESTPSELRDPRWQALRTKCGD